MQGKKIYFASDFHLGVAAKLTSKEREKKIVRWLASIQDDAHEIYLVGDVFDFWFEYGTAIPKGYSRLFGKLAELRDRGIPIFFFIGNHDMWMFRYFEEELDIPIIRQPIIKKINGKTFFIGHGDGLGPGDKGYKILKKIFSNKICQFLFKWIHPDLGIGLAHFWSQKSRAVSPAMLRFLGEKKEWLVSFCNKKIDTEDIDFFIFGHRHLPIDYTLKNGKSRYINIGEWMHACSYGVFDGEDMQVLFFENNEGKVFCK
ncbi:MAG TPA: UDP-2,3-diacylglucosamine diphosphatase [Phaeodactylibacter sp.]|nr:UDP-2,3-diacylglucosamine diphosphatase [Phaeodactylibacter sp.]